jgi:hypothetical protein
MDEIIRLVVQKTGISQDDARKAVEVIVSALKSKLPGPIASHLDSFISGDMSGGLRRRQIVDRYRSDGPALKKRRRAGAPAGFSHFAGSVYRNRRSARTGVIRSSPPCLLL